MLNTCPVIRVPDCNLTCLLRVRLLRNTRGIFFSLSRSSINYTISFLVACECHVDYHDSITLRTDSFVPACLSLVGYFLYIGVSVSSSQYLVPSCLNICVINAKWVYSQRNYGPSMSDRKTKLTSMREKFKKYQCIVYVPT